MFKKFISVFCMFFGILTAAHAGPAANIEYVHKMIAHVWGLEIPYNPELKNPRYAANMEYLLAAVDVANEMLNGYKTTDYKSDPKYATRYIADTLVTNKAVHELISVEWPFWMETMETDYFAFVIGAAGNYMVDWGDGTIQNIAITEQDSIDGTNILVEHNYNESGKYKVRLKGRATFYPPMLYEWNGAAGGVLFFCSYWICGTPEMVAQVGGNLPQIFPTLADGTNPSFAMLFSGTSNLNQQIPESLFYGLTGEARDGMFYATFMNSGFTGMIPEKLFRDVRGTPAKNMFAYTFRTSNLTGEIPGTLFAGLRGEVNFEENPDDAYANGPMSLFFNTFSESKFTKIGSGLFDGGGITYDANNGWEHFIDTFTDCVDLTGESAKIGDQYLYEIWPDASDPFTYKNATGLSDWCQIPYVWRGVADPLCDSDAEFLVHVKTPSANSTFGFRLGAAGEFTVDWGDGDVETIVKDNTDSVNYTHTYANAGDYVFGISGQATAYPTDFSDYFDGDRGAAIAFGARSVGGADYIYNIRGSLGHVFGTLADGSQPRFLNLFRRATNMTIVVPENLFDGIYGQPVSHMFQYAFYLSGIVGFAGPLFAGISGTPTNSLYQWTFSGCDELSLPLPDGMFGNLTGDLGSYTFGNTFLNSDNMTGSSARDANGRYLYEVWPDATWGQVEGMYCNGSQYTDMDNIPGAWTGCPPA
ncbi:MAG: hypothetical protein IKA73_03390 [Alphaproteobacteria bacterium]|nr:hypothetical protein [Alphaproteobacteria bacterium]